MQKELVKDLPYDSNGIYKFELSGVLFTFYCPNKQFKNYWVNAKKFDSVKSRFSFRVFAEDWKEAIIDYIINNW